MRPAGPGAGPGADSPAAAVLPASTVLPASPAGSSALPPRTVEEYLDSVRAGLVRLGPAEAADAVEREGALLVDIRYAALRDRDGTIPGAAVVERNELEWRLDPRGSHRIAQAAGHDLLIVVVCNEGYASSFAAASLHALGLSRATDLVGGFQAWRAAGLPVTPPDGRPTVPTPPAGAEPQAPPVVSETPRGAPGPAPVVPS